MAISVDWPDKVINVPRADLQIVQLMPTEIRQLDLNDFRLTLGTLSDDVEALPFLFPYDHTQPKDIGGVTLARVVEIINDYTVTFEDGQYAVNLVGGNSNVGDRTNVNQVSIRSANSAGLTYSKEVEDQSFSDSRVWINTVVGQPGTQFPRGTPGDPVSNLDDAQIIIAQRSLPKRLFIRGVLNIDAAHDISNYDITGGSNRLASLNIATGANTENLVMESLSMTGDINGGVTARASTSLSNLDNFDGTLQLCGLDGTITLADGGATHEFVDCYSEVSGSGTPIIDCNNQPGLGVFFRRYSGSVEIRNYTQAGNNMTIDMSSGHVILASSCTAGTIVVRGAGHITDNSGAGCTVVTDGLVEPGTGGLTSQQDTRLTELHQLQGLEAGNPVTNTPTSRKTDDNVIDLAITGDGTTISTVTRQ